MKKGGSKCGKFIADHLQNSNLLSFANSVDSPVKDNITPDSLTAFFTKIGVQILPKERDALFEVLDPKRSGKVTKKQFIDVVGPYVKEKPQVTNGIEKALNMLATHIVTNKTDPQTYFNKLDDNKNGFIERRELKDALHKIGSYGSDIEIANIATYFDNSKDGRINLKEFLKQMEPYTTTAKRMSVVKAKETNTSIDNQMFKDLKFKCRGLVRSHYKDLSQGFGVMEEFNKSGEHLISKENFKEVLIRNKLGLASMEIELIADHLVVMNEDGFIIYDQFLKEYSQEERTVNLGESQVAASSAETKKLLQLNTAEEVIKRLASVLKKNKINPQKAFAAFDKDGNGKVSIQEFK